MRLLSILLVVVAFATPLFADTIVNETVTKDTTTADFDTGNTRVDNVLDNTLEHTHTYTDVDTDTDTDTDSYADHKDPMGVGLDVVVYKFGEEAKVLDEITAEARYDARNEEVSVYGVVKLDLSKTFSFLKGGK